MPTGDRGPRRVTPEELEELQWKLSEAIRAVQRHTDREDWDLLYNPRVDIDPYLKESNGGWDAQTEKVWIRPNLLDDPKELRLTLLHEAVHIVCPDYPHKLVEKVAREIVEDEQGFGFPHS